ncbi:MAG: ABC transporter ATP-binding protein [Ignavibacteriae bacterium HGW-Ignavibacteriae-2]|jgi:energy-coupling factor transport system ATP-binding protein|nr:MAG: ABC transporter ATP-binding protein [Ignavibacteriae bacterium HGW-Ignavibacteriae-2]
MNNRPELERGSVFGDVEKFRYADSTADTLTNIKINIKKGEIIGVMGRTGSGKTSLLMLLNGLIPHFYEGEFKGNVISNTMNTQRYRVQTLSRFIGMVLQDAETQIFSLTVDKDVAFGPSNLAFDRDKIRNAVTFSLEAVGLKGYESRMTTGLSGGEKQRVAIAGVLAMEPEILVLDEPTSELDPKGKLEIYELLNKLRQKRDVTIIISGHDSEEMLHYVDRLMVMENGKIVWEGKPEKLFTDITLTKNLGICPPEITEIGKLLSNGDKETLYLTVSECVADLTKKLKLSSTPIDNKATNYNSNSPIIIETNNLCYSYDKKSSVLKNINIKIHMGEFVALIGKNGAGKTTFSKHLNGLLRPTNGKIFINGRDAFNINTAELSKTVGYVFQNPDHQIFAASVKEEIEYGLKAYGFDEEEREKRVKNVLRFVGMENYEERHPFSLGKGERQKLAVSSILAMTPQILVIDEPTTGQDWEGALKMMSLLKELHAKGHTIITITHNMRLAADYADRVIVFADGQVVLDDAPANIFKQTDILNKYFITPPQSVLVAQNLKPFGIMDNLLTVNELVENIKSKLN